MIIAKLSDCKLLGDSNTFINQDGTGCLHPCVLNFDVKCNVEVGDTDNKRQYDTICIVYRYDMIRYDTI